MPFRTGLQKTLYSGPLLGPLELEVMAIVWKRGECTITDVRNDLPHRAAYTTIITTMRRLVTKGFLQYTKPIHILLYSAKVSGEEWQRLAAKAAAERFLSTSDVPRDVLIEAFHQAVKK